MIKVVFEGITYFASLISCYDGDTCKLRFHNVIEPLAIQSVRIVGIDTPEIRGKCKKEKILARKAKFVTYKWMKTDPTIEVVDTSDKYGRMLVKVPGLNERLIELGLAVEYNGGKRIKDWCN